MSFEEKGTWAYLALAPIIPGIYFVHVLGQLADTPAAQIAWARPMLLAIGASIVAGIVAPILIGLARPDDIGPPDVRDRDIRRFGEFVGGYVLAVGVVGVLALTMLEFAHFWIANAIYVAFVAQAVVSSSVRLVAYRRGL